MYVWWHEEFLSCGFVKSREGSNTEAKLYEVRRVTLVAHFLVKMM